MIMAIPTVSLLLSRDTPRRKRKRKKTRLPLLLLLGYNFPLIFCERPITPLLLPLVFEGKAKE